MRRDGVDLRISSSVFRSFARQVTKLAVDRVAREDALQGGPQVGPQPAAARSQPSARIVEGAG
jgi:hypothetical protein